MVHHSQLHYRLDILIPSQPRLMKIKETASELAMSLGVVLAVLTSLWISTSLIFFIITQIKQIL